MSTINNNKAIHPNVDVDSLPEEAKNKLNKLGQGAIQSGEIAKIALDYAEKSGTKFKDMDGDTRYKFICMASGFYTIASYLDRIPELRKQYKDMLVLEEGEIENHNFYSIKDIDVTNFSVPILYLKSLNKVIITEDDLNIDEDSEFLSNLRWKFGEKFGGGHLHSEIHDGFKAFDNLCLVLRDFDLRKLGVNVATLKSDRASLYIQFQEQGEMLTMYIWIFTVSMGVRMLFMMSSKKYENEDGVLFTDNISTEFQSDKLHLKTTEYYSILEDIGKRSEALMLLITNAQLLYLEINDKLVNKKTIFRKPRAVKASSKENENTTGAKSKPNKNTAKEYKLDDMNLVVKYDSTTVNREGFIRRKNNRIAEGWEVQGHYRTYKSGKKVWVKPYGKGDKSQIKGKTIVLK